MTGRFNFFIPPFIERLQAAPGTLSISKDDSLVLASATSLNFLGRQVTVTADGSTADIYIGEIRNDLLVNRPNAVDVPSCLFFASDEKYWSYSNGTSWAVLLLDLNNGTSGTLDLNRGGTGATTAAGARTALELGTAAQSDTTDFDPAGAAATAEANAEAYADSLAPNYEPVLGYTPEDAANKGQPNGYASLDGSGKVPVSQLPNAIMIYKGTWDASTNTPTLADGTGNAGWVYRVTVAGTQNLGSGPITFAVSDYAIYNGTIWEKADTTDAVSSVYGRTGAVVSANGDYTASQVTNVPAGAISSVTVQAAINELDSEKQPLDSDLTAIAAVDSSTQNVLVSAGAGWIGKTYAQLKTLLAIVAADISDFNTAVRTNRLDQMATPIADVSWGSKKIISLANGVASDDAAAFGQIPVTLPPSGSAGGDLTGSYPNPTIAPNAVDNSKISPTAAIALTKLATIADARILGNNSGSPSVPLALTASQIKTLLAITLSDISGFASGIATFLGTPSSANLAAAVTDETGSGALVFGTSPNITTPTGIVKGDVGLGSVTNDAQLKIASNLADVASAPSSRYNIHDQVLAACQVVAVSNVASLTGLPTIDGVSVTSGNNVLLTAQSSASQNGPWQVSAGAWVRPNDYPAAGTVIARIVEVTSGTLYAGSLWVCTNIAAVTIDTTATTWIRPYSGKADTLATARTINGTSFDGSANIVLAPRTNTTASSATPAINVDTTDIFTITALAVAITSFTTNLTGTPVNGQKLIIRIKDNGTARLITWGASFASRGATLPPTTVLSKIVYVGLIYNSTAAVWDCVAVSQEI